MTARIVPPSFLDDYRPNDSRNAPSYSQYWCARYPSLLYEDRNVFNPLPPEVQSLFRYYQPRVIAPWITLATAIGALPVALRKPLPLLAEVGHHPYRFLHTDGTLTEEPSRRRPKGMGRGGKIPGALVLHALVRDDETKPHQRGNTHWKPLTVPPRAGLLSQLRPPVPVFCQSLAQLRDLGILGLPTYIVDDWPQKVDVPLPPIVFPADDA